MRTPGPTTGVLRSALLLAVLLVSVPAAPVLAVPVERAATTPLASQVDFPPEQRGYHTYSEMAAEVAAVARARPAIVRRFSIGESYRGRPIWAA